MGGGAVLGEDSHKKRNSLPMARSSNALGVAITSFAVSGVSALVCPAFFDGLIFWTHPLFTHQHCEKRGRGFRPSLSAHRPLYVDITRFQLNQNTEREVLQTLSHVGLRRGPSHGRYRGWHPGSAPWPSWPARTCPWWRRSRRQRASPGSSWWSR